MKRLILTIFGILFFTAAAWSILFVFSQNEQHPTRELSFFRPKMEVIANRGGALEFPENTLAAFKNASEISPDIILEMDLHYTKDNQVVVIQDDTVDRTTDGHGFVKDMTLEEIQKLDAGYFFPGYDADGTPTNTFPARGKGLKVPSLAEVFEMFPKQRMFINIKIDNAFLAETFYTLVKKFNRIDTTVFTSQHGEIIRYVRNFDKSIVTAAPEDELLRAGMLVSIGLEGLAHMPSDIYAVSGKRGRGASFSPELLKEVDKRNKKLFVSTINDPEEMTRLIKAHVDGIITDRPKALASLINTLK